MPRELFCFLDGFLDHLLVSGDIYLNATVLSAAFLGVVRCDGKIICLTLSGDTLAIDTVALKELGNRLGPLVGNLLVYLVGAGVVSVSIDSNVGLGEIFHSSSELGEGLF